jgi:hypothetical protein
MSLLLERMMEVQSLIELPQRCIEGTLPQEDRPRLLLKSYRALSAGSLVEDDTAARICYQYLNLFILHSRNYGVFFGLLILVLFLLNSDLSEIIFSTHYTIHPSRSIRLLFGATLAISLLLTIVEVALAHSTTIVEVTFSHSNTRPPRAVLHVCQLVCSTSIEATPAISLLLAIIQVKLAHSNTILSLHLRIRRRGEHNITFADQNYSHTSTYSRDYPSTLAFVSRVQSKA